jgi:hypothetical protein
MADPAEIPVPAGAWLKVATAVTSGFVHIIKKDVMYLSTYRETGGAGPAGTPGTEGADMLTPGSPISALAPIDVYVYVVGSDAGRVRVDV